MRKEVPVRPRHSFANYLSATAILVLVLTSFHSCRKDSTKLSEENEKAATKFFAYDASLDTGIKRFIQEIKRQSDQYHFLDFFVDNNGYPDWNGYRKAGSGDHVVALIPFSFEQQKETNGFIVCRKNGAKYDFALYKKDSLLTYGFVSYAGDSLNARQVQTIVNDFNYKRFGITAYRIPDRRILPDSILKKYPDYTDPALLEGHLKFKNNSRPSTTFRAYNCITYVEETEWWYNPDGDACNCNKDEYYVYSTYTYNTTCVEFAGDAGSITYGQTQEETSW